MIDLNQCSHTREAFGNALLELASYVPGLVVIDSDVSTSTKTDIFAQAYPDRFFNIGIAEQNMVGIAAGMALSGKIPFVTALAVFGAGRAWEQIRMVCLDNLNVKFVMTHAGLSPGGDGATHQGLEDIALMRVLPNMKVIIPADEFETRSAVNYIASHPGPAYIRLTRRRSPKIFKPGYIYDPKAYPVIATDGIATDAATILTNGCMIREALLARKILAEQEGMPVRVVNVHTVKPLNKRRIRELTRTLTGVIITVEEHSIYGGLGSAVAEALPEEPIRILGVKDRFGMSGPVGRLYDRFGISAKHIANAVVEMVK